MLEKSMHPNRMRLSFSKWGVFHHGLVITGSTCNDGEHRVNNLERMEMTYGCQVGPDHVCIARYTHNEVENVLQPCLC